MIDENVIQIFGIAILLLIHVFVYLKLDKLVQLNRTKGGVEKPSKDMLKGCLFEHLFITKRNNC